VVIKEWRPRTRLLRWYSSWILGREMRHYGLLSGLAGVPRFVARVDANRFLIEHIDAEPIHRGLEKDVLHAALDNLESVIASLHARGFAHLDLRHKGNILVGAGGRVWVIDFGQGLDCSRGPLRRLIFPLLRRIDRSAVTKFRARYAPETLPPARREKLERAYATRGVSWMPAFGRLLVRLMAWTPRHRPENPPGPGPGLS
jgi:RIO-like serine/threonine protein kinase